MTNKMEKTSNTEVQKAMKEVLESFLRDKNSAKEFSVCMQESNQWLKEKGK